MFKLALAAIVILLSSLAQAETLTYVVDYESMSDIDSEVMAECKGPETIRLQTDADTEFETQISAQMYPLFNGQGFVTPTRTDTLEIEGRNPNYAGPFRVTQYGFLPIDYPVQGLLKVEVFGPVGKPTGLVITSEVAQEIPAGREPFPGPNCGEIWYRLEK